MAIIVKPNQSYSARFYTSEAKPRAERIELKDQNVSFTMIVSQT